MKASACRTRRSRALQGTSYSLAKIQDFATFRPVQGEPHLEIGWPGFRHNPGGDPITYTQVLLPQAAALLGVSEDEVKTLVPVEEGKLGTIPLNDGTTEWYTGPDTVLLSDVVYCLLTQMPRDLLRKLLRDLDAV